MRPRHHTTHGPARARGRAWALLALLATPAVCAPDVAQAQGINVVAPRLPPRAPGAAPAGPPASQPATPAGGHQPGSPAPGGAASSPGYGTQPGYGGQPAHGTPSGAQPGYGTQPGSPPGYGGQPVYGTPGQSPGYGATPGYGGAPAARPGGAPPSVLAGRAQQPYAAPAPSSGDTQVASVAPTRSTAAGNCRVDPAPDRQSVSLLGTDALPRTHVALGEYRVQQVVHSPDGRWAVAFTKLRGQPRFAVMTFDLARCEAQHTVDLPAAGDDARFDGDEAIVTLAGGERRVRLPNPRVR